MKVYISGKIGEKVISDATRQKFARAEEMLKAEGYTVFNPTSKSWQEYLSIVWSVEPPIKSMDKYSFILLEDLQKLAKYDAVYFLEDWDKSPGANAEHSFAMATGKKILFASREQAALFLEEKWRKANKAMNMRTPRHKYVDLHLHELWMPIEQK